MQVLFSSKNVNDLDLLKNNVKAQGLMSVEGNQFI